MLATNGYAFRAAGRWVAVDAPEGAAAWMVGEGIEPELLLLTHQHFDHVLCAAEVADRFACPIWAFSDYDSGLTLETFFRGFENTGFEVAPYEIARLIADTSGGVPELAAGTDVEVSHVPGHSPDSVCFVLREAGVVFGGDVLFNGGVGRTDFPGGDMALLVAGIREKLLPLGDGLQVLPGHGPPTTIGDERAGNPFIA